MAPVGVEKKVLLGPNGPAVAAAGDLTSEEEEGQSLWSSILSEVSTRARSKLPSGKNILVFGERRRRGVARGAGVGEAGVRRTGPSLPLPCCLPSAGLARWPEDPGWTARSTTSEVGVLPFRRAQ
ncbi:dynein cytoplasmic 1 light intermediate chain 2 [Phyllostomus discolor]|uniref:Dynein light intermediate chain n=1 Tax=Phyllostomus discolor TaxID=89673 RepID=A0A833YQA7_9CHIR|nr:dynein cytoplasmic 1 light intermediate chain 2 [Phyllostomus discolor]